MGEEPLSHYFEIEHRTFNALLLHYKMIEGDISFWT
jgi:hypothetical protein